MVREVNICSFRGVLRYFDGLVVKGLNVNERYTLAFSLSWQVKLELESSLLQKKSNVTGVLEWVGAVVIALERVAVRHVGHLVHGDAPRLDEAGAVREREGTF